MKFWKRLNISVFKFDSYYQIAGESIINTINYFIILNLLCLIIIGIVFVGKVKLTGNALAQYMSKDFPDFKIENNLLEFDSDKPIIIKNLDQTKIVFDTKSSMENDIKEVKENNFPVSILFGRDSVLYKSKVNGIGRMSYASLNRFGFNTTTKSDIINILNDNAFYLAFFVVFVIGFLLIYLAGAMVSIFSMIIVGFFISRSMRLPLRFRAIFSIAVSSLTLPTILALMYSVANVQFGFYMPYFQVMYSLVAYIYMIFSIVMMKTGLIKTAKVTMQMKNNNDKDEPKKEQE